MELLQVGSGSVFEHAITLQRGLTIVKSLCHLPTRHIGLFQDSQLLCPLPPPSQVCGAPPGVLLHQPGGLSEVLQSRILTAMGGFDCVGFNHVWVKLKMVLSSYTSTCLVFSQAFYNSTLASQLWAGPAAGREAPRVFGTNPSYCQGGPVPLT